MIEISFLIAQFRALLITSLPIIEALMDEDIDITGTLADDWIEANWELLIESYLFKVAAKRCYVQTYGEAAELYPFSSRAFYPEQETTHKILCLPKNTDFVFDYNLNQNIKLTKDVDFYFEEFVTMDTSIFEGKIKKMSFASEPYDYVECRINNQPVLLKVEDCFFYVVEA